MTLYDLISRLTAGELAGWALGIIIACMTLIQVVPVKLNPWDKLFAWLGRKMNGATEKRLQSVEKQVLDMWVNSHRQCILTFAREARAGIEHSSDEWTNVLNIAEDYEVFIREKGLSNGIVTQDTEYIRNLYQQLSREHRI